MPDANVVNRYGASPLAEAVRVANAELVGMLLEAGADANVANEDGQTALMLAARTGNVAVAKLLVQHGADVNRRERYRDQSAVMWAAAEGHADMVAFLVSKGADLSVRARANDWETQITQRAARAVSPDRRPDPAPLRGAGGMSGLREGHARGRRRRGPAEPRRHDADDDGARQRLSRRGPLPARPRRQPAYLGLVGPHAALRGGDDAWRAGQSSGAEVAGVAGVRSRRCSTPA